MKKVEIFLIVLSIVFILLDLFLIPRADTLTITALSSLSILYFYLSIALFNDIQLRNLFKSGYLKAVSKNKKLGAIGAGITLSYTIIGILFHIMSWPGAYFILLFGLLGMSILTVIALYKNAKNKSVYYTRIYKRFAFFGALGLMLFLAPSNSYLEIKYRNYPAYIEAYNKAMNEPQNQNLWKIVDQEKAKIEVERK